ncbi:MAG TPA: sigma 54-interacting transcriptional regulator [Terriglobales bacterium]|nr:sigma 54-interacting transcriptional regulator [Terriglobales bacterium]
MAEFSSIPQAPWTNILPGKRPDQLVSRAEMLARRYEALSRLSSSLASGTPEDWIRNLTADLRGILRFDLLDVVVYKKDTGEAQWRSPAATQLSGKDIPMEESLVWCVYQHQRALWIADCNTDEGCAAASQRLKNLELGYRSFYGLPLNTPYRRLGVIGLASLQPNSFTAEDVEFVSQVAGQLALAIDNWLAHGDIADLRDRAAQESVYVEDEIRGEMQFEGIIGKSAALRRVLKQVETVAPTNSNVLIFGETGTGKELIARAIHDLSPRRPNVFVTLNCAAIPTGLLESELFGHERGAFTGAISQRIGRFELANRGTILLDEVGEIPLELQPKLLRVLQQREFERLGNGRTLKTDARLIAATNRDLKTMVEEQRFRADLFYRLNVFPIQVPPLRERPEDIPLLVRHFVQHFARRMNRVIDNMPSETMEGLVRYCWPGNIRELENVIERAVILSPGPILRVQLQDLCNRAVPGDNAGNNQTLEEVERAQILATLKQTKWVLSGPNGAAIRLGLNRSTLQFRMKKLGIARPI